MAACYFHHAGIPFPSLLYSPRALDAARDFNVEDDDVFNVTYQKSGTVWMLEILSLIRSDGDPGWCRSVPNWDRAPWFETVLGGIRAQRNQRPRLISSHLPVQLFAKRYFQSDAKVIYTVRNPKDVLVSLFHFARIFRPYKDPGNMEEFMEKFLKGDVPFGSWFDHVQGWMQLRGRPNFFYITYEELQQDLRGSVQRLCSFLGRHLSPAALDAVVSNASFSAMSSNRMSNFSLSPPFILDVRRAPFLRKGIAGDWKNHLTAEQSERFDRVYREKMAALGALFPWDVPVENPQRPLQDGTGNDREPTIENNGRPLMDGRSNGRDQPIENNERPLQDGRGNDMNQPIENNERPLMAGRGNDRDEPIENNGSPLMDGRSNGRDQPIENNGRPLMAGRGNDREQAKENPQRPLQDGRGNDRDKPIENNGRPLMAGRDNDRDPPALGVSGQ